MVLQPKQTTHPHDGAVPGDMPGDQRPARAIGPQAVHATPGRTLQRRAGTDKPAAGIGKIYAILGLSGSITLVVGAALAVSCTAWALSLDVPRQVAYLAGYITVAASACICAALVAVRHSVARAAIPQAAPTAIATLAPKAAAASAPIAAVTAAPVAVVTTEPPAAVPAVPLAAATAAPIAAVTSAPKPAPKPAAKPTPKPAAEPAAEAPSISKSTEPDYDAWNGVAALRVADAARLWCGVEPGRPVNPEVMARARTILEAIEQGELPKSESTGVLAQYKIGWHTEVRRDALKAWAESQGPAPRFLRD